jgi:hypothetical protein
MAKHGNKAPGFRPQTGSTLIRVGRVKTGIVTDGHAIQPVARVSPHNANSRYLIPNRFLKKVDA